MISNIVIISYIFYLCPLRNQYNLFVVSTVSLLYSSSPLAPTPTHPPMQHTRGNTQGWYYLVRPSVRPSVSPGGGGGGGECGGGGGVYSIRFWIGMLLTARRLETLQGLKKRGRNYTFCPILMKNRCRNTTFSSFLLKYRGRNYTNFPEI